MPRIKERGLSILRDPLLNKGTAFSAEEKEKLHLYGFLPPRSEHIAEQLLRCKESYQAKLTLLEKHIYLRALQDRNEVLFYRFLHENLIEMLPIIYTPVVGEACLSFHRIHRQVRGLFLSYTERNKMEQVLKHIAKTRKIAAMVVTDGERILGLGDQGVGGLGIAIGKLSLYTVCGGIHPARTLPIVLDVGTNNEQKLADPEYFGWRHPRVVDDDYDDFVDQFITLIKRYFPHVLLQFEDFAQHHAYPLLERYRNQLCCFNDDIQGTAAVVVSCVLAATKVAGTELKKERIVVFGGGSAGCGVSEHLVKMMVNQGLTLDEAISRIYIVDKQGLLRENLKNIYPFQKPFVRKTAEIENWTLGESGQYTLDDVVNNVKPSILLGFSGQTGQFTEQLVSKMALYCQNPIIFPLSNPSSHVEASPNHLLNWTKGRAIVATGSPFDSVYVNGRTIKITQCNNAYIFPGLGLGVIAAKAKIITDNMFMASALALSELKKDNSDGSLLPNLTSIRQVSKHIAKAVILSGIKDGIIEKRKLKNIDALIRALA